MALTAPPVKQSALKLGLAGNPAGKDQEQRRIPGAAQGDSPDAIIVVGYGRIIPHWMLELPRYGNINLHASLLPKYRGAAPIQWAIANGETVSGVTTMRLDEGLDTGDILLQKEMAIRPEDTAVTFAPRLAEMGADLIVETLRGACRENVRRFRRTTPSHARADPKQRRRAGRFQPHRHGNSQSLAWLSALARSVYTISRQGIEVDQRHAGRYAVQSSSGRAARG